MSAKEKTKLAKKAKQKSKRNSNSQSERLAARQILFCKEYLIDLNGTQAAIRAGYTERSAFVQASRMLKHDKIKKKIEELKENREKIIELDAAHVLKRLKEIDELDISEILDDAGTVKDFKSWPESWRRNAILKLKGMSGGSGWEIKVQMPDKLKNLELLGKHTSVGAFKDKIEIESTLVETKSLSDLFLKPEQLVTESTESIKNDGD